MSNQTPEVSMADLCRYMKEPRHEAPDLRERVQTFVVDCLRLLHQRPGWSNWRESGRWSFMFDEDDRNVPENTRHGHVAARSTWVWTFTISERGPLITCETFSLTTEEYGGLKRQF